MVLLSITGFFRTILILVGVLVVLRFIGRLMTAKRNMDAHNQRQRDLNNQAKMMDQSKKDYGKITISKGGNTEGDFASYEEIKE